MAERSKKPWYSDPGFVPFTPPVDVAARLGAALLGSEVERKGANLLIRFDERRDLDITRNLLLQARDAYKAPR